jgi:protein-S-isoprenylcysteine O-methyltransferase Ste14
VLVILPLWVIYITNFQIIPEEEVMEIFFKEDFINYCKKTRRWI